MAQNLFEKYGIKEVADVTLYRIERKDETYESQRKISISSILKGALTKEFVYPLDEDGKGDNDGFEAYVFKDADVLTHFNYDCDDTIEVRGSALFIDNTDPTVVDEDDIAGLKAGEEVGGKALAAIIDYLKADAIEETEEIEPNLFYADNVTLLSVVEQATNRNVMDRISNWLVNGYVIKDIDSSNISKIRYTGKTASTTSYDDGTIDLDEYITYFTNIQHWDLITLEQIIEYVGNNGVLYAANSDGSRGARLTSNSTIDKNTVLHTDSYISFKAPKDATPEMLADKARLYQMGLYKSLGVVTRFTQPIRVGTAVSNTFSGTITTDIVIKNTDGDTVKTGTITITFADTVVDDVPGLKDILDGLKTGNQPTVDEIKTLIEAANAESTMKADGAKILLDEEDDTIETTSTLAEKLGFNKFMIYFTATLEVSDELHTGRWDLEVGAIKDGDAWIEGEGHFHMDTDAPAAGTHEFSYPEQVCMLYAKNQNLITKAGTRYQFTNAGDLFGAFEFSDEFASAPNSKERVVVVGLVNRLSENLYDLDEINGAIKELTDTIDAKAYDITYSDYAELAVEDEMGYYLPQQLGAAYDKKTGAVTFFQNLGAYKDWAGVRKGYDVHIFGACKTWGDMEHYSINDAIDALKQESKLVDVAGEITNTGYTRVFGGYKVSGALSDPRNQLPLDDTGRGLKYQDYTINGRVINNAITGDKLDSFYNLESVLDALSVADLEGEVGDIRITESWERESNRAIYVDAENGAIANRAAIYLLRNVNVRSLATDKDGIFEFYDKKGNRLYYQDKVFAGTAYLALVTIGTLGLVFVVDRHCTKNFTQTAWMINDGGYITDKQAERIVKNGLIHTVTVTACDESFDATCTVGSIKIRKTKKNVLRYVPVLFLDSLKVSTIEQASETTDATGGRGNAKLITWDYGKDITLSIEDALYTPASMSAIWAGEHGDLKNGVKDTHMIDRFEPITAKRSFIVPAGNHEGVPSEGNVTAQAVYYDPKTMEPFQDGTPIAEGELVYKFTRSVAYDNNSIGNTIEISADKFPGTYRVVGETMVRDKKTGEDQRFQFIIPEAKMSAEDTSITLEADGDPVVFSFTMNVLRPDNGVMMKFVQFDVVENEEENDGSTMVKDTENLNLLDDAEMYKVSGGEDEELVIGATEY